MAAFCDKMIKSTFILVPGIGRKTEEYLWKKGIFTWDDLGDEISLKGLSTAKLERIKEQIAMAKKALTKKDASFFARYLPQNEYWRVYREFQDKTLFLDIETTGISSYYNDITVIGTFDGKNIRVFVKDNDLDDIVEYLKKYEILVTFNGKLFDIPFIREKFPDIEIPPIHIDLRFLLRSIGISGPLKEIEKRLGIEREADVQGLNGREVPVLWNRFVRGDHDALRRLILYNIYDTVNLKELMDFCYSKKCEGIRSDILYRMKKRGADFALPPSRFIVPKITLRRNAHRLEIRGNDEVLIEIERKRIKRVEIKITHLIKEIKRNGYEPLVVGIDPAGTSKKPSGICILREEKAYLTTAITDEEIISKTLNAKPHLISIDSPLHLPVSGINRKCEKRLKKRGINAYPPLIESMKKLTMRGIRLSQYFEEQGYEVIESYPGAAQDILRFPRKKIDLEELKEDLTDMGIRLIPEKERITHDEIDALTSALVGYFYLAGMYEAIGDTEEGYLIVPVLSG